MPVSANDFLTSRGSAGGDLVAGDVLSLGAQIGASYKPYLVSCASNSSQQLTTPDAGVPATARFFLMSCWLNIQALADGVYFPYQNNATPGIAIGCFSSGLVQFIDASINHAILWEGFSATPINPGLNNLIVSCDTVGKTYEAVLNGTPLTPSGPPENVSTSFTCDNSGNLFVMQASQPGDEFTELWFDFPGGYISAASVIAKFYAGGNPVDPGTDGSVPFGTTPVGYFTVRDASAPPVPKKPGPASVGLGGAFSLGGNQASAPIIQSALASGMDANSVAGLARALGNGNRASYWPDFKVAEGVR